MLTLPLSKSKKNKIFEEISNCRGGAFVSIEVRSVRTSPYAPYIRLRIDRTLRTYVSVRFVRTLRFRVRVRSYERTYDSVRAVSTAEVRFASTIEVRRVRSKS